FVGAASYGGILHSGPLELGFGSLGCLRRRLFLGLSLLAGFGFQQAPDGLVPQLLDALGRTLTRFGQNEACPRKRRIVQTTRRERLFKAQKLKEIPRLQTTGQA